MILHVMRAEATQEADGCRRGVKLRQLAVVDSLPVTRWRGVDRGRLKDGSGDAVGERTINDITRVGSSVKEREGEAQKVRTSVR